MSIGSTIKRLRCEKDITQEQLAEYLGITSRAVSQWECDRTAPDISQLPALCHIFDVSSDILLGIDIEKNNEEIKKYLKEATDFGYQGKRSERTALLREANKKFPRDYGIMAHLADSLVNEYSRNGTKDYEEVFELCNRVLAECTDSETRYDATQTLAFAYGYAGKKDEMLRLAEEMPRVYRSYENFMAYKWQGEADFEKFQEYMSFLIYNTADMLFLAACQRRDNGEFIYSLEERIFLWKTEVAFLELLFPNGDFQFKAQLGEQACSLLCVSYLRNQEYEKAWKWVEKAADFALHMDTYDFDIPHTSPVLRGYSDGGYIPERTGNRSYHFLEWLTMDEETAALRSDARFGSLVERIKTAAKER